MIAMSAAFALATGSEEAPKGWFRAGNRPNDYEMATDRQVTHSGKSSASLKSIVSEANGFGTLMQTFKAGTFRGKRVRMSGHARAEEIIGWAGFWMRVDGGKGEPLAFDNMEKRAIKGTSDWRKYEIVLDVSEKAEEVAFGMLLSGKGQVWLDDLKFEIVGTDVPATAEANNTDAAKGPTNLDFEE